MYIHCTIENQAFPPFARFGELSSQIPQPACLSRIVACKARVWRSAGLRRAVLLILAVASVSWPAGAKDTEPQEGYSRSELVILDVEAQMVDCAVCRYWSERLEENRTHLRAEGALEERERLIEAFQIHQRGACACRFPDLLKDLVKQQPKLPDTAPGAFDPSRTAILVDHLSDDFGVMPAYEWRQ